MLRQNTHKSIDEFVTSAKAPLEHMFGNHIFCSADWCNALKAEMEGKVYTHPEGLMDKTTDQGENIHEQLEAITDKYGSKSFLLQSIFSFNMQSNEALNYSQACITPKAKSSHESSSFNYQHAIVVACRNWEIVKFGRMPLFLLEYLSHKFFASSYNYGDKKEVMEGESSKARN